MLQYFVAVYLFVSIAARPAQDDDKDDKDDKRTTTTWIPILEYNKEQGQDGSYRAS